MFERISICPYIYLLSSKLCIISNNYMYLDKFGMSCLFVLLVTIEKCTSQTPLIPPNTHIENILSNSSMGARLVQVAHARHFQNRSTWINASELGRTVELLLESGDVVGLAIREDTFVSGMELNGLKLFLSGVAVRITRIDDTLHWTGEVVGERLGMYIGLII